MKEIEPKIIECAKKILALKGPYFFTLTELSQQSGITKSHLRYYYPNLDKLIETVIVSTLSKAQQSTSDLIINEKNGSDPTEKISLIFKSVLIMHKKDKYFSPLFLMLIANAAIYPNFHKIFTQWIEIAEKRIEIILLENFRKLSHSEIIARSKLIHHFILGASIKVVLQSNVNEKKEYLNFKKSIKNILNKLNE